MRLKKEHQQFLIRHGHRVAVGVVVLIAGLVLLPDLADSGPEATQEKIDTAIEKIRDLQRRGAPAPEPRPSALDELQAGWQPVDPARQEIGWAFNRMPGVKWIDPDKIPPVVVTDPTNMSGKAELGGLNLSWRPPPRSRAGVMRAELYGYRLTRWPAGREKQKIVRFLPDSATRFTDRKFEARTTYHYKLEAIFEHHREGEPHKVAVVSGGTPGKLESGPRKDQQVRFSQPVHLKLTTLSLVELEYTSQTNEIAGFQVKWYDLQAQEWKTDAVKVKPGEMIPRTRQLFLGFTRRRVAGRLELFAALQENPLDGMRLGGLDWGGKVTELQLKKK